MKVQSFGNLKKGSATLEILIAFAILTLTMGAIIMVTFGNQSIYVDAELNGEALDRAQKILEDARAQTRNNFNSLVSGSSDEWSDNLLYSKSLLVNDVSQCSKEVTSSIEWATTTTRSQKVELTSLFTDISGTLGLGGDCDLEPPGEWDNPITADSLGIGGQGATDIDVQASMIYITSDPSAEAKEDFYIYEFDPIAISLAERGKLNIGVGVNAVDVGGNYAYLANASTTNSESSDELVIVDVSDPDAPSIVSTLSLGIVPNCPIYCPGGAQNIFYLNNRVYIGTHRIGGNELYVIDVSNRAAPFIIRSFNVDHNVNDLVVRGNYAYIATSDNSGELHIYNVSDPGPISLVGTFNTNRSGGDTEDGTSIYLLGNKIYLGRERVNNSSERDFYIIDISNPISPVELGSKNLNLSSNTQVVGIAVRSRLAFLAIDNPTLGFNILNISNPSSITNHTTCTTNFPENTSALDMENNFAFTTNNSNDEIRVLHDQSTSCTP